MNCSYCHFRSRYFSLLLRHYQNEHSHQPDFRVKCGIDGCNSSYTVVDSLRKHIIRKHKNNKKIKNLREPIHDEIEQPGNDELLQPEEIDGDEQVSINNKSGDMICKFLLNMREKHGISEDASALIVKEYSEMLSGCISDIKDKLNSHHLPSNIKNDILSPIYQLKYSHSCLDSVYQQHQAFKELGFIDPIEIMLPDGNSFMYVPLIPTLKSLLSHKDIQSFITNPTENSRDISDYKCGTAYKSNALFQTSDSTLQIKLYLDDFQVVNPLGNRTKTHKICGLYWTLGNIPPKYSSKLFSIQIACLCQSHLVKKFGHETIFQPLIDDLKLLENEGISLIFSGGLKTVKGTVTVILSDNLAAHEIGGYCESFSAYRCCRFCDASRDSMQENFDETSFNLSTSIGYDAKATNLQLDPSLSTAYGMKRSSVFNALNYYHVCWGLPSDVAHDIFEGVAIDVVKHTLEHGIKEQFFSADEIHDAMELFPYSGKDSRNKPVKLVIDSSGRVNSKQTASQCQCLVRLLPLIIGNKYPPQDKFWNLYCLFLTMLDFILAPALNRGQIQFMKEIITNFLEQVKSTYNTNIKPKMHFLIHYPTQYETFGPLIYNSTLRFEGKHSYLKSIIVKSKNYVNTCKSMIMRHQFLQCHHGLSTNYVQHDEPDFSKISHKCNIESLSPPIKLVVAPFVHPNETDIITYNFVSMNGIRYQTGAVVIINSRDDHEFAMIVKIIQSKGDIFLLLKSLKMIEFSCVLNCYHLCEARSYMMSSISNLFSPFPISCYRTEIDTFLLVMPHFIQQK